MVERKARFRIEERHVVGAMQLASERKLPIRLPIVLLAGIAVVALSLVVFDSQDSFALKYLVPALIFLLIVVSLLQYAVIPWQARQHARQSVALKDEITLEWDEQNLRLSGDHGQMRIAWEEFHRWSENDAMILLYQSNMFFHVVPKSALDADQCSDLTERLTAGGVKKR